MRRSELKRGRRRVKPKVSADTVRAVARRTRGRCACGCGGRIAPFPIGYHHVFEKARWPELTDVAENIVGVTADCHANHETASKRLPRAAVAIAEALARTGPMQSYLEREYPQVAVSARTGDGAPA